VNHVSCLGALIAPLPESPTSYSCDKIRWLLMVESNSDGKSLECIEKYKDDDSQFEKDSSKIVVRPYALKIFALQ
jgi:hypothetical protein